MTENREETELVADTQQSVQDCHIVGRDDDQCGEQTAKQEEGEQNKTRNWRESAEKSASFTCSWTIGITHPNPHTCLSLYVTESWSCWGGEAGEWGNGCDSAYLSTKVTSACVCTAVLTQSQLGCSAYQSSLCHIQHLFWLHTAARWSGR